MSLYSSLMLIHLMQVEKSNRSEDINPKNKPRNRKINFCVHVPASLKKLFS